MRQERSADAWSNTPYNGDDVTDNTLWADTQGSASGTSADGGAFVADGDDDVDDHQIWSDEFNNSLSLFDVA